jgi:hypothetical protein
MNKSYTIEIICHLNILVHNANRLTREVSRMFALAKKTHNNNFDLDAQLKKIVLLRVYNSIRKILF